MHIKWTHAALGDLKRLYDFLVQHNPTAAKALLTRIKSTPSMLQTHPHLGVQLSEFLPRDVRRLILDNYELRYEVTLKTIYVLRVWHLREEH